LRVKTIAFKTDMSNQPRRKWRLCNQHNNCATCSEALANWKWKANKHSYNASRLKYVLDCFLSGNMEVVYEGNDIPLSQRNQPLPIIPIPQEEEGEKEELNFLCGVCYTNCEKTGKHQPLVFDCSHTLCVECYNKANIREVKKCPFCRGEINKVLKIIIN